MKRMFVLLSALFITAFNLPAAPVGSAFTYQGRLNDQGVAGSGLYDFQFALYDSDTGPNTVAPSIVRSATVSNGLFVVTLDFGAVFNGEARWLGIAVRTNGSTGTFTTLSPRQPLTPTPYAITAGNLSAPVPGGSLSASNFWQLSGNAGTTAGTHFLGTTDSQHWI